MRRTLSLLWKLILIGVELVGLALAFQLFSMPIRWEALNYFTNLSNMAALVYYLVTVVVLLRNPRRTSPVYPLLKGCVIMGLTLTMLVAQFMLGGSNSTVLVLLHIVCPLMVLLDWLLFDEKGITRRYFPLVWSIPPILYLTYVMIAARIGDGIGGHGRYPYPFIDIDVRGVGAVAVTAVVMLAAYLLVGYLLCLIDHAFARLERKKASV